MPREIKVAAGQLGPASQNKQENVARIVSLVKEASEAGVRIMNLPELALTTYFPKNSPPTDKKERDYYFDVLPNNFIDDLVERVTISQMVLILPYAEKAGDRYFNSAIVINSQGNFLGQYRKVHMPEPVEWVPGKLNTYETAWFSHGDLGFPVFDIGFATIGILICYDRHFPEAARCLALNGAEIVFLCTNSPTYGSEYRDWRSETHEMILRMRAYENTVFVVSAEKGGIEQDMEWLGESCIISPDARVIRKASRNDKDELVIGKINLDAIVEVRKKRRFLAERKPEHYIMLSKY